MRDILVFFAVFLSFSAFSFAEPNREQYEWFGTLSPEEAVAAKRVYEDFQRQERWDSITEINVTDFMISRDMRYLNDVGANTWGYPVPLNETRKVWWAVEMPKKTVTPFDIQIQWVHEGKIIRMQTYAITKPSPNYHLHDLMTVRRAGRWEVRIVKDGKVLATRSFNAR